MTAPIDIAHLRQLFSKRMREAMDISLQKKYVTHSIEGMLQARHAVELAKQLVQSGSEMKSGLQKLAKAKALELSFESIMLEKQFAPLFSKQDFVRARWNLSQVDPSYQPPEGEALYAESDQINETATTPRVTSQVTKYKRDSAQIKLAKDRASNGKCELCGCLGFETLAGSYYLEGHHVIPLNCNGDDTEWNIAMLCPDDHKIAHFGRDRLAVRDRLIAILGEHYPAHHDSLQQRARAMDSMSGAEILLEDLESGS
jgi:5-methylcytosine-specific restriction endonuclease McrA